MVVAVVFGVWEFAIGRVEVPEGSEGVFSQKAEGKVM